MPTSRPLHIVTETEEIARALDDAALRWPSDSGNRARLLRHLVQEGHGSMVEGRQGAERAHRQAVMRTSGAFTGLYGEVYLDVLREDWPT
ncbi:MAG: hypothetical protein M0008_10635 [Actinomycetota bacterium]|nr:hypothetical protein [Actinomycetota bacterium]